ncbi:hypothetical protein BAQ_B0052 (plasmid) [Bacillus anthracis str. A0193]|nr:hypothetical protein BAQ_B0052 [Bacillus anthracis str. A0193]
MNTAFFFYSKPYKNTQELSKLFLRLFNLLQQNTPQMKKEQ